MKFTLPRPLRKKLLDLLDDGRDKRIEDLEKQLKQEKVLSAMEAERCTRAINMTTVLRTIVGDMIKSGYITSVRYQHYADRLGCSRDLVKYIIRNKPFERRLSNEFDRRFGRYLIVGDMKNRIFVKPTSN